MVIIEDFHFSYKRKRVFSGLDLRLEAGRIYGLLGPNGAGKSTLLRSTAGLLFPRQGKIEVLSFVPGRRQPSFLQQLFIVPEEFYLPDIPVEKYIRCNAPFYPAFDMNKFHSSLEEFNIPHDSSLQQMSYGQKKKVLIAFGLASNARLLLLDEPTNGLDIPGKSQFRKLIAGNVHEDQCILISTHQVKDLDRLIDNIVIINEGKVLFNKSIDDVNRHVRVKLSADEGELRRALYREDMLGGSVILIKNTDSEEGNVDIELLYKAMIANASSITSLFDQNPTK